MSSWSLEKAFSRHFHRDHRWEGTPTVAATLGDQVLQLKKKLQWPLRNPLPGINLAKRSGMEWTSRWTRRFDASIRKSYIYTYTHAVMLLSAILVHYDLHRCQGDHVSLYDTVLNLYLFFPVNYDICLSSDTQVDINLDSYCRAYLTWYGYHICCQGCSWCQYWGLPQFFTIPNMIRKLRLSRMLHCIIAHSCSVGIST